MRATALTLCLLFLFPGCGPADKPAPAPAAASTAPAALPPLPEAGKTALAQLDEALVALENASQSLTKTPSAALLKTAQSAWQTAYGKFNRALPWLLGNPAGAKLVASRLDAVPMEPGYIDALKQWPDSGIVNDPTLTLDAATLVEQNQVIDDSQPSLGFQVVEFLLWGNDELPRQADDFRFARRATYLELATHQLHEDVARTARLLEAKGTDAASGTQLARERLARIRASTGDNWVAAPTLTLIDQADAQLPKPKTTSSK